MVPEKTTNDSRSMICQICKRETKQLNKIKEDPREMCQKCLEAINEELKIR